MSETDTEREARETEEARAELERLAAADEPLPGEEVVDGEQGTVQPTEQPDEKDLQEAVYIQILRDKEDPYGGFSIGQIAPIGDVRVGEIQTAIELADDAWRARRKR